MEVDSLFKRFRETVGNENCGTMDYTRMAFECGYNAGRKSAMLAASASETPAQPTAVYRFDRYRDGNLMAEGGRVNATSIGEALGKVKELFHDCPGDTFRSATPPAQQPDRRPSTVLGWLGTGENYVVDLRKKCPTCDSTSPHLHPAMQHEGEVQPCRNQWHAVQQEKPE